MRESKRLPESELDIMLVVWKETGTVTAPAILSGLERPLTASALHSYLKRLEEKGYLHYEPSGKDLRYKQIVLDDKAYQCAKQLHARFEAMERKLYQGLSDEELELTRSLLLRLLDNISKEEEVVQ